MSRRVVGSSTAHDEQPRGDRAEPGLLRQREHLQPGRAAGGDESEEHEDEHLAHRVVPVGTLAAGVEPRGLRMHTAPPAAPTLTRADDEGEPIRPARARRNARGHDEDGRGFALRRRSDAPAPRARRRSAMPSGVVVGVVDADLQREGDGRQASAITQWSRSSTRVAARCRSAPADREREGAQACGGDPVGAVEAPPRRMRPPRFFCGLPPGRRFLAVWGRLREGAATEAHPKPARGRRPRRAGAGAGPVGLARLERGHLADRHDTGGRGGLRPRRRPPDGSSRAAPPSRDAATPATTTADPDPTSRPGSAPPRPPRGRDAAHRRLHPVERERSPARDDDVVEPSVTRQHAVDDLAAVARAVPASAVGIDREETDAVRPGHPGTRRRASDPTGAPHPRRSAPPRRPAVRRRTRTPARLARPVGADHAGPGGERALADRRARAWPPMRIASNERSAWATRGRCRRHPAVSAAARGRVR